jgi:hypothetical protein
MVEKNLRIAKAAKSCPLRGKKCFARPVSEAQADSSLEGCSFASKTKGR